MHHHADVRLVDTHTKGIGSHHDTHTVVLPVALTLVLDGRFQSGMIEGGTQARFRQQFCYFAGVASASHIDNGRTLHAVQQMNQVRLLVGSMTHEIGEVLALERHAENAEGS